MSTSTTLDTQEQIAARAYEIWEEEGYPTGRERIHWRKAMREYADAPDAPAPARGAKLRFRTSKKTAFAS